MLCSLIDFDQLISTTLESAILCLRRTLIWLASSIDCGPSILRGGCCFRDGCLRHSHDLLDNLISLVCHLAQRIIINYFRKVAIHDVLGLQFQVLGNADNCLDRSEAKVMSNLCVLHDHIRQILYRYYLLGKLLCSHEAGAVQQDLRDEDGVRNHHRNRSEQGFEIYW